MIRVLFTGGGTGGHIYPILAIAEEIKEKRPDLDLYYLGAPGPYKTLLEANGIKVSKILSSKWRRYFDIKNFLDIPKFIISLFQCLWKIFWLMPDVLFSKGGPGSLAVVLICRFYRIPVIIHESDAIPGITNQISSRFANKIAISFASAAEFLKSKKGQIALVGTPIRRFLFENTSKEEFGANSENSQETAKKILGFDPQLPLILVICGSQGSNRINNFFLDIAEEIVKNWQVLHQTGYKNYKETKEEFDFIAKNFTNAEKSRYQLFPYLDKELKDALTAADLVVGRAGSNTIFELAALGKPAILIPLPEQVVGRHQIANAYAYANSGAAIVFEQDNLKPHIFLNQLKKLFSEEGKLESMSRAALKFAKPDAAKIIAEEIIKLG